MNNFLFIFLVIVIIIVVIYCLNNNSKEKLKFFDTINTRYWPQYYYSFPYSYKYGGTFPTGMYSRLKFWSPGFYSGSGLRYDLRPDLHIKYWPRNRWINNNNSYYNIYNDGDYKHNAANYTPLPLHYT